LKRKLLNKIPDRNCHVRSRGFWWPRPRWRERRERGGRKRWRRGQFLRREGNVQLRSDTSSSPSPCLCPSPSSLWRENCREIGSERERERERESGELTWRLVRRNEWMNCGEGKGNWVCPLPQLSREIETNGLSFLAALSDGQYFPSRHLSSATNSPSLSLSLTPISISIFIFFYLH